MERVTAFQRMQAGFRTWAEVDLSQATFVMEEDLRFEPDHIACPSEALVAFGSDDDWSELLSPTKTWINASLLTAANGRIFVSLRPGPPAIVPEGKEPSINVSMEPRQLRIM